MERRRAGERVILPDVVRLLEPRANRRVFALLAGIVVLAVTAVGVLTMSRAVASASALEFAPSTPERGVAVDVRYRPNVLLSSAGDTLVLRARLHSAAAHRPDRQVEVARMVRSRDGTFRGRFRLPDSVVFAAFAIEDRAGERIDDNRNRLWSLEVHGADGRPEIAALSARIIEMSGRSWEGMLETARRMTELYADDPRGWGARWRLEPPLVLEDGRDSVHAGFRSRFTELHEALRDETGLEVEVVHGMVQPGNGREHNQYWLERLWREYPDDARGISHRLHGIQAAAAPRARSSAWLEAADDVWATLDTSDTGSGHAAWLRNSVIAARREGDSSPVRRWTARMLTHGDPSPTGEAEYIRAMAEWPELTGDALELAREVAEVRRTPDDRERPLRMPRSAYERQRARDHRAAIGLVGELLIATGDTTAGVEMLRQASADGWDVDLIRTAARELLAGGDTAAALRRYVLLAVDPEARITVDSAVAIGGPTFDPARWAEWRDQAVRRFRAEVLSDTSLRPLARGVDLVDAAGRHHRLEALVDGPATVVTFLLPQPSADEWYVPQLEELHGWLGERGMRLVVLTDRMLSDRPDERLRELGATFPVYYDLRREARDALRYFTMPAYWIVDGSGMIVFDQTDFGSVRRQVTALMMSAGRIHD